MILSSNFKKKEIVYVSHPEYYNVEYQINIWMSLNVKVDKIKAIYQWEKFVDTLTIAGAEVVTLPAGPHPDTVFIADAGIVINNKFILSNFKHFERQVEQGYWYTVASSLGYEVIQLPDNITMEGTGDCLIGNQYAFLGIGNRSNGVNNGLLSKYLQRDIIPIYLEKKEFFHLDTCMAYISDSLVIMYPDAISLQSRKQIEKVAQVLYINKEEAYNFATNILEINNNIIIQEGNSKITKQLSSLGFNIIELDTSEFIKGGGSCKCLSLKRYN